MQILLFISGLGILLLAMRLMEQALASLGEGYIRRYLLHGTRTPVLGVMFGILTTAILQSSSIVGLMTMAFVGAGILPLRNAIGIILGSNLGTTFTGWLVAWIGFRMDLAGFYDICIGSGALLTVLSAENSRKQLTGRFITAFGLLLFGLVLMKDSISFIIELVDVESLRALPVPVYFLFGMLLTALIQSSSATMMISLSAVSAGILDLHSAAALVIGADLGTTSTIIIGAMGGTRIKRQIALVHFIYNLMVDLAALLALPLLLAMVSRLFAIGDPLYALVAIHSSFNFLGLLVFVPCAGKLVMLVMKLAPAPAGRKLLVNEVTTEVPAASFAALEQDVRMLLMASILLNGWRLGLLNDRKAARETLLPENIEVAYDDLKDSENQLTDYLLDLGRREMDQPQVARLQQLRVCIRDCLYSTKAVKDLDEDMKQFFRESDDTQSQFLEDLLDETGAVYSAAFGLMEHQDKVAPEEIKKLLDRVRLAHGAANARIYEGIDRPVFAKQQASTALNINRDLLLAGHSLVNALEHCLLQSEQALTVSELLNLRN
jgi:phosphate:Na+ symporter